MLTIVLAVNCADVSDAGSAVGTDTPDVKVSDETRISPKVMDVMMSAFLEDTNRHATTVSEVQVEAAQAVLIFKRGLKAMI